MTNIHTIKELAEISSRLKGEGKTVAYCHGEFDLLHFGHLRHFKQAAKQADVLMVTITPDRFINKGPGRPVYNESYRAEFIDSLECVDYVGINEWPTAENSLKAIRPDVYCKGNEYVQKKDVTGRITVEKELVESLGGKLHFTEDVVFSSSELSKQHFNVFSPETLKYLKDFCQNNDQKEIIRLLDDLSNLSVLVVGSSHLECEETSNRGKNFDYLTEKRTFVSGAITAANQFAQLCNSVSLFDENLEVEDFREFLDNRVNTLDALPEENGFSFTLFLQKHNVQTELVAGKGNSPQKNDFRLLAKEPAGNDNGIYFSDTGETILNSDGNLIALPAFTKKENPTFTSRKQAFCVAACGHFQQWKPEVTAFLAASTLAMAQETASQRLPVEIMPLSKYVIALMK